MGGRTGEWRKLCCWKIPISPVYAVYTVYALCIYCVVEEKLHSVTAMVRSERIQWTATAPEEAAIGIAPEYKPPLTSALQSEARASKTCWFSAEWIISDETDGDRRASACTYDVSLNGRCSSFRREIKRSLCAATSTFTGAPSGSKLSGRLLHFRYSVHQLT